MTSSFDDFQLDACGALESGHGVLVAAPTGSGKTVVGEFAVHLALAEGRKCFYTTPIKALSNQKYADLVRRYSAARVGLLTGDNSINGEAPIVVMTTEVLRNMLYAGSPTLAGLGYVVLDEVHYLADRFRGAVWEEVIIHLPESVRLVALSATVSNAEEFGDWLAQVRGGTTVIVDEHRPVPLWQHMLVGARLYDLFTGADGSRGAGPQAGRSPKVNPELRRVAERDAVGGAQGRAGRPARGGRRPARFRAAQPARGDRAARRGRAAAGDHVHLQPGRMRRRRPAVPGRGPAADHAGGGRRDHRPGAACAPPTSPPRTCRCSATPTGWPGCSAGSPRITPGCCRRSRRSWRSCSRPGLIRAVFATETLALGINMPARTVVIERLDKWNGENHADLTPGEYTQLTGRAGRRGIDVEGHAVVLWQPGVDPVAVAGLAGTRTYPLTSSFRPSYNMAVNLVGQVGRRAGRGAARVVVRPVPGRPGGGRPRPPGAPDPAVAWSSCRSSCDLGDFAEYQPSGGSCRSVRPSSPGSARRHGTAEAVASLEQLRRGDIIQVPGGRRAGIALVLELPRPRPRPTRPSCSC